MTMIVYRILFAFAILSLLTTLVVKKSYTLAGIYLTLSFSKRRLRLS